MALCMSVISLIVEYKSFSVLCCVSLLKLVIAIVIVIMALNTCFAHSVIVYVL